MTNGIATKYVLDTQREGQLNLFARQFADNCKASGFTAHLGLTANGVEIVFPKGKDHKPVSVKIIVKKFEAFRKAKKRKVRAVVEDVPGRSSVRVRIRTR